MDEPILAPPTSPPPIDPRLRRLRTIDLFALATFVPDPGRWEITGVTRADVLDELRRRGVTIADAGEEPGR